MVEFNYPTPDIREPKPQIYDLSGGERQVIWHDDPNYEMLFNKLVTDLKPKAFFETGTYKAGLLRWIAERYPDWPLYSVEASPVFFGESVHWMKNNKNVHLELGLSQDWLLKIHDTLLKDGLPFIYLDAHALDYPFPLPEELVTIQDLDRYICVVDDINMDLSYSQLGINVPTCAKVKGFEKPYVPSYPMSGEQNRKIIPNHHFVGYAAYVKGVDFVWPETVQQIDATKL